MGELSVFLLVVFLIGTFSLFALRQEEDSFEFYVSFILANIFIVMSIVMIVLQTLKFLMIGLI